MQTGVQRTFYDDAQTKLKEELSTSIEQIKDLHVKELLAENQYNELKQAIERLKLPSYLLNELF